MDKKLNLILIGFLILMIAPFVVLFFFNQPTPEDFSWSETTRSYGYLEAQKFFYNVWSGRYFSYSVLSLNPLLLRSIAGYKICLLLFFFLFTFVTFRFISIFTKNVLLLRERLLFTFSFIFLFLYAMPSVSEGLYWLTAVFIYQLGIMLLMLFVIFYKKIGISDAGPLRIVYILISSAIIAAAAGTSELTSLLILILNILLLIRNISLKNELKRISLFLTTLAGVLVFISFSSPGNSLRSVQFGNSHNLLFTLQFSFLFIVKSLFSWIFISPLLLFTVLLSPLIIKLYDSKKKDTDIKLNYILFEFLFLFILLYALISFTVWNLGEAPVGRSVNVVCFVFLAGWFYIIFSFLTYIKRKININFNNFPKYVYVIAFILISILLIRKNNIRTAFSESLRGSAYNYDQKLNERYLNIISNGSENCQVDSIKNKPKSFFLYDITTDPENYYNKWYSLYFNKKTITIK